MSQSCDTSLKSQIKISKFSINESLSSSMPPSDGEGFLFLELPDINSLLYLGGSSPENFGLYIFDIEKAIWSKPELKGDIPPPMAYAAGWYDPPFLFIHGGKSLNENKSLKETYLIDITSMIIHQIFTIEEPSSRYGHLAVKNNDKQAYIFGGCNIGKKSERYLSDLHKMEYKNISIITDNNTNINGASWIVNIQTKGDKPPGRKGYSMQFLEQNNSLIIYGGELKDNKINDDAIYLYNIDEKEYKKINIDKIENGKLLGSRAYHTIHLNDTKNKIYIIGGINNNKEVLNEIIEIDINNIENIKIKKTEDENLLNKRYGHKGCNIFFGGENDKDLLYHILILGGKKSLNEFHDNSLIDIFINNNIEINNNIQKEEDKINFNNNIDDIKNKDIDYNMNKILNKNKSNEINLINNNTNIDSNSLNKNKNLYNIISNDNYNVKLNNNINNNIEIEKKKKNYLETLIKNQNEYIKLYDKYKKINNEYYANQNKLKELQNNELYRRVKENINKNKLSNTKIEKIKGEMITLKKIMKENKSYNDLLNEYMNIYKDRFCFLSDFLNDYVEDIMKMDNILMEYGFDIPGINYESFSNKRKRYKMLVINLCREIKVYNIFEKELYDKLIKYKECQSNNDKLNNQRNILFKQK